MTNTIGELLDQQRQAIRSSREMLCFDACPPSVRELLDYWPLGQEAEPIVLHAATHGWVETEAELRRRFALATPGWEADIERGTRTPERTRRSRPR